MMQTIKKKILPEHFEAVAGKRKCFEIRKDEDGISEGDIVILREWSGTRYTGRCVEVRVTFALRDVPQFGLEHGYCIFCWNDSVSYLWQKF